MIKNELQYRRTKGLATDLEMALHEVKSHTEFKALSPLGRRAYLASLKRQLRQFNQELQDYEKLKSGKFDFRRLPDIEKIPSLLIQARIAKGLAQEDLARLLKLKKQQIQQYESTEYASASLSKIRQVAEALLNY
jgi:ribosome-binding protein aMBF1 (putative translation factor)